MKTSVSHTNIVKLSVIRRERASASLPFGPVRAGLTTSPITLDPALMELLNSLERKALTQQYRSYTVSATSISVTRTPVLRLVTTTEEDGIEKTCDECGNDLAAQGQSKCLECLESMI